MNLSSTFDPGPTPAPRRASGSGEPVSDDAAAQAGEGGSRAAHARTEPLVLLVEDNHINQVVALEFLALMHVRTQLAKDGMEALAACQQEAPNLVLMDIQMPGMDGLECSRRLREMQKSGRLPHFPILALTAHALESDVSASLAAGMDEHLTKPLDFVSLRQRLGRWLKMPSSN